MMAKTEPTVQPGLDRLLADKVALSELRDARVGVLCNPTSVTSDLEFAVDALRTAGVEPVRLFGPEHGVTSAAQDMESVEDQRDDLTDLPVVSLYGEDTDSLRPNAADLEGLDIVLADIQDVGARYYTYANTVGLMMEACGAQGIEVWVLDRPNPIGGTRTAGPLVNESMQSFVGMQPLPTRHGMTMGELATFFDRYGGWSCDFRVVAMRGYSRSMWFDETGLPWVMPSPNMPTLATATVYPGQCLLEGTNLSEGRGTTRPFELFGAPYVDAYKLRDRLREFDLPGVAFRPVAFRPKFQKHANRTCYGLQLHITDRYKFESLACGYAIVSACHELFDAFSWRQEEYEFVDDRLAIDLLLGDASIREQLESSVDPVKLARSFDSVDREFDERREACLIYD